MPTEKSRREMASRAKNGTKQVSLTGAAAAKVEELKARYEQRAGCRVTVSAVIEAAVDRDLAAGVGP